MRRLLHCLCATLLVVCFAARAGAEEPAPPTFGHSGQWTFSVGEGTRHRPQLGQPDRQRPTRGVVRDQPVADDPRRGRRPFRRTPLQRGRLPPTRSDQLERCDYQHQPASRVDDRPARGRRFLDRSCGRASHRLRRGARALGGNLAARGHQHRILRWKPIERRRHRTGRNDQHPRRVDDRSPLGVPSRAARRPHCRANLRSEPLDEDHHNCEGGRPERQRGRTP